MLHPDAARNRRIDIGLVTLTTLCFAVLDRTAKWLLLAPLYGRELVRVRRPGLHLLRVAMLAAMTGLNFWALQYLQLAETGAIQFSVPLLSALLSAWQLGGHLDAKRCLAIVSGFVGVLLVIRPGTQAFHPAILLPVVSALLHADCVALAHRYGSTATRGLSATNKSST